MNNNYCKRIVKTRQVFSELSRSRVKDWKLNTEVKNRKEVKDLQNKEIERINEQLIALRDEYERISCERGCAHRWAQIVAQQELDSNEFEKRRNTKVLNESKHKLKKFLVENSIKRNNSEIQRQNRLLKRKQLMKSSLNADIVNEEDIHLLRELQKSENVLRELIQRKKQLSHSEESIEKQTQRLFWPQILTPNPLLIDSNGSSIGSEEHNVVRTDSEPKSMAKAVERNKDLKELIETEAKECIVESEVLPISIATKVYERLRTYRKANNEQKKQKVYRNVAVSTDTPVKAPEVNSDSSSAEDYSIGSSRQTSYLSVPSAPQMSTNKATKALSELYKNYLLNKRTNSVKNKTPNQTNQTIDLESDSLQDLTLIDDPTNSFDPLIDRINHLKELIDRKVERNASHGQRESELSAGDAQRRSETYKSVNALNPIKESLNEQNSDKSGNESEAHISNEICDTNSSSSSSAMSFKTLQAISSFGRSSPLVESLDNISEDRNRELASFASNVHSIELMSNNGIDSMSSSVMSSMPLRDRNAFWREVFDRAGIDIDINRIEAYLPVNRTESEPNIGSFSSITLSSFSNSALNSHSTPKR